MLKNIYLGAKLSFSYFSILPVWFKPTDDLSNKSILGAMLLFFPFVGMTLAIGTVVLFSLLEPLAWYGAVISALFYMLLYGFLHTEAVIDVMDAIYAAHGQKDAYSIIKEPTVGAMGVLYGVATLLVKVFGVAYLLMHGYLLAFIAITIVSRVALLLLFRLHTFFSSFANQLKESLSNLYLFSASLLILPIGYYLTPYFLLLLISGLLLALAISYAIKQKIGFVNGDVLGATLEWVEILLIIGVAL